MDESTIVSTRDPTNRHVYRLRLGWRVFMYLFAIGAIGGLGGHAILYPGDVFSMVMTIFIAIPIGVSCACFAVRGRLTITADTVEVRDVFWAHSIRRDEIVGYGISRAKTRGSRQVVDRLSLVSRFNSPVKSGGSLSFSMVFDTDTWFDAWLNSYPVIKLGFLANQEGTDPQQAQEALDEKPKDVDWVRRDD